MEKNVSKLSKHTEHLLKRKHFKKVNYFPWRGTPPPRTPFVENIYFSQNDLSNELRVIRDIMKSYNITRDSRNVEGKS